MKSTRLPASTTSVDVIWVVIVSVTARLYTLTSNSVSTSMLLSTGELRCLNAVSFSKHSPFLQSTPFRYFLREDFRTSKLHRSDLSATLSSTNNLHQTL